MVDTNFVECKTIEEANSIDMHMYSFIKFSDTRDCYIFKKRAGK